jgi:hypothetical protein
MPTSYFLPSMPEGLEGLVDMALDLRWSWNHAADELWRKIAPDLWDKTGNPWLILQTVATGRLQSLTADAGFRKLVDDSITRSRYKRRTANEAQEAAMFCRWRDALIASWHKIRFGNLDIQKQDDSYAVAVTVYLDDIDPKAVQVQLYADPLEDTEPEIHVMEMSNGIPGTAGGYIYHGHIPARRPAEHYTPRIIPHFDGALVPLEIANILWYER